MTDGGRKVSPVLSAMHFASEASPHIRTAVMGGGLCDGGRGERQQGFSKAVLAVLRQKTILCALKRDGKPEAVFKRGDFVGNFHEIESNLPSCCRFKANTHVKLFAIDRKDMVKFAEKNPGLIMKFKSIL